MAIDQWDINIEFGYQIVYHKFRMLGLLFYQHYRVYRYNWVKKVHGPSHPAGFDGL